MRRRNPMLAHADWSVRGAKRMVTWAVPCASGRYLLHAPEPVGDLAAFVDALTAHDDPMVIGVDAIVGVPTFYARLAGITSFPRWLADVDEPTWQRFATPADVPEAISVRQPFYPARSLGARRSDLVRALGAPSFDVLSRRCESREIFGADASPLFWTVGARQVGRASVHCWQTLVRPLVQRGAALWPFDTAPVGTASVGMLAVDGLSRLVLCEASPARACRDLGLGRITKSTIDGRRAAGPEIAAAARRLDVELTRSASELLRSGFPTDDALDSFVGALGMVNVVRGHRPCEPPEEVPEARTVEGWILGV